MPKANNNPQPKPWYKNSDTWGWIVTATILIVGTIVIAVINADTERINASRPKHRSYEEIFTPEECEKMGIGRKPDGPGNWKADPEKAARNVRKMIESGGNADPAIDALQDSDFYDAIDQLGGEEGF